MASAVSPILVFSSNSRYVKLRLPLLLVQQCSSFLPGVRITKFIGHWEIPWRHQEKKKISLRNATHTAMEKDNILDLSVANNEGRKDSAGATAEEQQRTPKYFTVSSQHDFLCLILPC